MDYCTGYLSNFPNDVSIDMDMKDYHDRTSTDDPFFSSHQWSLFNDCPAKLKKLRANGSEDKKSYLKGRAFHTYVLELNKFSELYTSASLGPVNGKTGSPFGYASIAYRDWVHDMNTLGRTVLSIKEYQDVLNMGNAVMHSTNIMRFLRSGLSEVTFQTVIDGVRIQARPDYLTVSEGTNGLTICAPDLKKCRDIEWFPYDAKKYKYQNQLAIYRLVIHQITGVPKENIYQPLLACEDNQWNICGEFYFSNNELDIAEAEMLAALKRYKECMSSNEWPTGYETPTLIGEI